MDADTRIRPVIVCGGTGTGLWPLSRDGYPKQFYPLHSARSLLQEAATRVADPAIFHPPLVVANAAHRFLVADQLRQVGVVSATLLLEPFGRNTAPATLLAALFVEKGEGDATDPLLLILPADHIIPERANFTRAVEDAAAAARTGLLLTFGLPPTEPETAYGYIRPGAALANHAGVFTIETFVEKPGDVEARAFIAEGKHLWNSGLLLTTARTLIAEVKRWTPAVEIAVNLALADAEIDQDTVLIADVAWMSVPAVSLDTAVMERTDRAAVLPCDFAWRDVGSWSDLWNAGEHDRDDNVADGDVAFEAAGGCYVRSTDRLTAVIGLTDTVVVSTDDALLVAARDHADEVGAVVACLRAKGRSEVSTHREVHRPWGLYRALHAEARFQVKYIEVMPGGRLSLQRHHHRAEHWVVVSGTALVTRGTDRILIKENESIYIPIGEVHRLENPGQGPLQLIEVQSGSYLGEDDIVRLDDIYGRDRGS